MSSGHSNHHDRNENAGRRVSRRSVLRGGSAGLLACAAPAIIGARGARAQERTLRILQWRHFVPAYDEWFNETYVREWGERNDTRVIVENVGLGEVHDHARAEVEARAGHDLVLFIEPPTAFADHVVDHREIYEEAGRHHGGVPEFVTKATFNPTGPKHFGFCCAYLPQITSYRKDLWDSVQMQPDTWDDVLEGGRRIRLLHDRPVGISFGHEHNAEHSMRAAMYAFGAHEQDADGRPTFGSKETVEVVKYMANLYEQAMTPEVLGWDPPANNRFMLTGEGSLTLDTMSISRAAESLELDISDDLRVAMAPAGPAGRLAPSFGFFTYAIWRFSENIDGAKRFLVDYVAASRDAFLASGFQNKPTFEAAVPDLADLVAGDPVAMPADKYAVLADGATWSTNLGYPGYTNRAVGEVYDRGIITRMMTRAATGLLSPEEAVEEADREVRQIFQAWEEAGRP